MSDPKKLFTVAAPSGGLLAVHFSGAEMVDGEFIPGGFLVEEGEPSFLHVTRGKTVDGETRCFWSRDGYDAKDRPFWAEEGEALLAALAEGGVLPEGWELETA